MPNRNTMDLSNRCPGHLGRMMGHARRVQSDLDILDSISMYGRKRPARPPKSPIPETPGASEKALEAFRVHAFRVKFAQSRIKSPVRRFVDAMDYSLRPVRNAGLVQEWFDTSCRPKGGEAVAV